MKRICLFCGANVGSRSVFADAAREISTAIARHGWGIVYGGGNVGLMGVIADAALGVGGEVIGVIPKSLVERELAHAGLNELHIVATMHERKALMADLSDVFIALPGGFGTLDEFFEILTWAQLGIHAKPCGLLNVEGYFDSLLAFLDRAMLEGFLREQYRRMFVVGNSPSALLALLPPREFRHSEAKDDPR